MKCPNCGREFEGERCPNCGRPVAPSPVRTGTLALWVSMVTPLAMLGACTGLGVGGVFSIFAPASRVWPLVLGAFVLWLLFAAVISARNLRGVDR